MICLLVPMIVFFFQGCWSSADVSCNSVDSNVSISCMIINLEYVECNWTKPQMQQTNYTFSSLFWRDPRVQECQEYLREQNHNVGCRIPLKDSLHRFHSFDAKLSDGGNQSICKKYPEMTKIVKLHPPSNISVNSSSREGEVCVCWIRSKIKPDCVNYTVGYQKDSGLWKFSTPKSSTSFCVSPVSSGVVYTFKVRSGISDMCGPSNFWSDWSDSVQWINNEGDVSVGQPQSFWHILGSVVAVITFIILVLLLIYSERIRVSVAPDPTKSLQDLFKKYNGNVESWVYISRELKDAFDPDYTESPCVVSEPSLTLETKTKDVPMEQPVS